MLRILLSLSRSIGKQAEGPCKSKIIQTFPAETSPRNLKKVEVILTRRLTLAAETAFSQNKAYVLAEQPETRFYCCASTVVLERGGTEGGGGCINMNSGRRGRGERGDAKNEKENRERVRMREKKRGVEEG